MSILVRNCIPSKSCPPATVFHASSLHLSHTQVCQRVEELTRTANDWVHCWFVIRSALDILHFVCKSPCLPYNLHASLAGNVCFHMRNSYGFRGENLKKHNTALCGFQKGGCGQGNKAAGQFPEGPWFTIPQAGGPDGQQLLHPTLNRLPFLVQWLRKCRLFSFT